MNAALKSRIGRALVLACLAAPAPFARGHVPYLENQDFTTTAPFVCPSPEQSIAVYAWLESADDVDCYRIEVATTGTLLYAGLIVPALAPYEEFRPRFALLGPGLPTPAPAALPAPAPPGWGAQVAREDPPGKRETFYEPFGGKSYYRGPEIERRVAPGEYLLVYWDPRGKTGDYVAVVGKREVWTPADMLQAARITPVIRRGGELHLPARTGDDDEEENTAMSEDAGGTMLFDFAAAKADAAAWSVVNDTVMGGVSSSRTGVADGGALLFTGDVSLENNGGFASVRGPRVEENLESFAGLAIRVKGDGKKYKLTIRTDGRFDGVMHQAPFTTEADAWRVVRIPFEDFIPTYHGRRLPDDRRLRKSDIATIGFLIADKQAGPFRLEIGWIAAWREKADGAQQTPAR